MHQNLSPLALDGGYGGGSGNHDLLMFPAAEATFGAAIDHLVSNPLRQSQAKPSEQVQKVAAMPPPELELKNFAEGLKKNKQSSSRNSVNKVLALSRRRCGILDQDSADSESTPSSLLTLSPQPQNVGRGDLSGISNLAIDPPSRSLALIGSNSLDDEDSPLLKTDEQ